MTFSTNWLIPYQGGCFQCLIASKWLYCSICDWENEFFTTFRQYHLFCGESFSMDFWYVHLFQLLKIRDKYVSFPDSPRVQYIAMEDSKEHFLSKLDGFVTDLLEILDDILPKNQMEWSVPWMVHQNVVLCLPVRQAILNISQLAVTFHGICPPIFIQTWLQQYRTHPFLNSAYCSFSNPICFWTVRGWRTMLPRKIFTILTQFQGSCQCKWLLVSW